MSVIRGIIEFVMDILETVVFMGAMFIVVYLYILQPNQVRGSSMLPTFEDRDYIFTSRVTYKLQKPERGDVVVFRSPQNQDIEYIKRVIGIPGDTIRFTSCQGDSSSDCEVVVNGKTLIEKYIKSKTQLFDTSQVAKDTDIIVPDGKLFVMGDNRPGSLDSRVFGAIEESSVIGVVFLRYLPTEKAGFIKNPFSSE